MARFFSFGPGLYLDVASVPTDNLPGDGQSQPGAMLFTRGDEGFNYPGAKLLRNASARIGHGQLPRIPHNPATDGQSRTLGHGVGGITCDVYDNPAKTIGVDVHRSPMFESGNQNHVGCGQVFPQVFDDSVQPSTRLNLLGLQADVAPGIVQQFLGLGNKKLHVFQYQVGERLPPLGVHVRVGQQFSESRYDRHGIFQVVDY